MFKRTFWQYRYQLAIMIIAGFFSAFLEGIGINAVIPLFSFAVKGQELPTDFVSRTIKAVFLVLHIPYTLKFLLILISVIFVFKAILSFVSSYFMDAVRTRAISRTRTKLLDLTLAAEWPYLSKQKIGHLEMVIMNEVQSTFTAVFGYASSLCIVAINALIYIGVAFNISANITLLTLALGGGFFWVFKPFMDRVRRTSHETSLAQKDVANHISESIIGMKTIKAMSLERKVVDKGSTFFERFRRLEMRQSMIAYAAYVITQPLTIFVISALFAYSYTSPDFSFVSFMVVVYAINRIFQYLQSAQGLIQNIHAQYPYMRDVIEYEDRAFAARERLHGKTDQFTFEKEIVLKNVTFSYTDAEKALDDVSLTIKKGEMIGIAGPSGSGKTTLVDIILDLIRPQSGSILVDGKNVNEIKSAAWKKHIGYVSQDIFLVNDSIRNNIAFYDPSITDEEILSAAKKAHIYDFIMSKPQSLDTRVGERGMELSGGQRQRIALARVLARKADILVLDEATSALDNESEAAIKQAIDELRGTVTIIIIAHRPTTVDNVDRLYVIKKGKLVEQGSPSELLAKDASYYHTIYYGKEI